MSGVLKLSAILEIGTGLALVLIPELVATLLLGAELNAVAVVIARCFGVTLIALGLSCWSSRRTGPTRRWPLRGMFTYNALLAAYLGYLGGAGGFSGPLLWPAVALHAVVAMGLVRGLFQERVRG
ncbi:MAG: hypothetical protein R2910_05570 [Gemmatimonadales bacterium]